MAYFCSQSSSQIKYVVAFVCLLLILKFKGVTMMDNNSSNSVPQIKYDVFFSFRGVDIREGFFSHLVQALSRKHIVAFVDYNLLKGDGISESLLGAIEKSFISLIIFSQNYASSRWCLLELSKAVECRQKHGQIVLPVFYKVDPSDVRHQRGNYGNALAKHEGRYSLATVQIWRSALNESANLVGFHSSNFRNEAELVEEIVKCVSMRLDHVHQVNSKGLVGIAKPMAHVESMLQLVSAEVRAIGIWGMGGIGKTTIAEEVFNKLCFEFESCCFMANIREEVGRHGIISLKKKLFSTLLGEHDLIIDTPKGLPYFVERRLQRIKVLIVLDDVDDSEQLDTLVATRALFGSGSRIIITTRDKQVLANKVDGIYQVEALNFDDSLRLFNSIAFKQNHLEKEFLLLELSKRVVHHAKGVPLAVKVLGHLLHGKEEKEIWESQLERLKKVQSQKLHRVIKSSYDDLDRDEKKLFLDIACFFDALNLTVNYMKLVLETNNYSVVAGLERLKDKALISISQDNVVSMPDIIQETAWEIVRQESMEDPGNQSRLFDPDDIHHVLKNNKGTEAIRSIVINLSRINGLHLDPEVFAKMSKLHFLDMYNKGSCCFILDQGGVYLPKGLDSLPNELRYLRWAYYPLQSLPSNFSAEKLAELNLPYSQVKKLWHQVQMDLEDLRVLILHASIHLMELPDLSKATNLKIIDLRFCVRLTSVHPSVFSVNNLVKLNLAGCISLKSLVSDTHLSSLRYLSLSGCVSLKEFSVISENMVKLNLELTGIKQLPSSIGLQSKLETLRLADTFIDNLPTSIKHLTNLRYLDLKHCIKLQTLPELPPSLETLDARGCVSLKTVLFPLTAMEQLKENKKKVAFWNCLNLVTQSLKAIELNAQINMMKFAYQHLSTFVGNAHGTYVYPGSKVPEWLAYKTIQDYMTVDLSFASKLGFIFCFIVPKVPIEGLSLKFIITTSDEDEGSHHINLYLESPLHGIKSDHVYLVYDRGCSRYLNNRARHQPKMKIKVTALSRTRRLQCVPLLLRGFGISPINNSQYLKFIQQMELRDTDPGLFRIPDPLVSLQSRLSCNSISNHSPYLVKRENKCS